MKALAPVPMLYVNDAPTPVPREATVQGLARALGFDGRKGVAVALNGVVVPHLEWTSRGVAADDRVLIIQATQGG